MQKYELTPSSNARQLANLDKIVHMDLHRVQKMDDEIDWIEEELLETSNIICVEWPERLLKKQHVIQFLGRKYYVVDCKIGKKGDHYFRVREN
jgi:tRNA A37 threonylcarbamoyladenosine biosynthesis protein TsaE